MKREKWEKWALDIDVYVSEMVIYLKDMLDISKAQAGLQELFGIKIDNNLIYLDMKGHFLEVVYEQAEDEKEREVLPLFKNILYQENAYTKNMGQELPGVPVMVFIHTKVALEERCLCWRFESVGRRKRRKEFINC